MNEIQKSVISAVLKGEDEKARNLLQKLSASERSDLKRLAAKLNEFVASLEN